MEALRANKVRLVALAIALILPSQVVAQDKNNDLPNFYRVNDVLYRGGQPSDDGFKRLAQLGIKTVLDLRDDGERAQAEELKARSAGLKYLNMPMGGFLKPNDKRVAEVMSILSSAEHQPVFVHCQRGSDRTGTIIAIYRIDYDGWTSKDAKEEAKRFGLGFWQIRMRDYISDYNRNKSSQNHSTPRDD
jgi:protein tyrosine/serine phosphatase